MASEFIPKSFTVLGRGYTASQFGRDLLAGVIVGIVALPLAIAFAIASGVSPEKGLITAVVAGFFISAFGGSRVQIGGPTGAFIVIVYGIVQKYGIEGLTVATFIAGFMLMLMGFLRFGVLLKYFPHTLIVGFTTGIAVIIFSAQMNDLFGLGIENVPADFLEKWAVYASSFRSMDLTTLAIGAGTILITALMPRADQGGARVDRRDRGGNHGGRLVAAAGGDHRIPVRCDPEHASHAAFPHGGPRDLQRTAAPRARHRAVGRHRILLSAVVADGSIGGKHRSNMELVAQGGANILSALFGGIPATGAIARTATNVKNGGRTPMAGMVHAVVLLLIMLVAGKWAALIPMSCLAGILVVVAWNMAELHSFRAVFRTSRYDMAVLLATFLLTVVFDLVIAIEIGLVLAAFLFMKRMSDSTQLRSLGGTADQEDKLFDAEFKNVPKHVLIYEINGPLFFGAAQTFTDTMKTVGDKHRVLILRMRHVPFIDATGLHRLKDIMHTMERRNVRVALTDVVPEVERALRDSGILLEGVLYAGVPEALASDQRNS